MTASSRRQRTWFHRTAIAAILAAGVTISVFSFWILRETERKSAGAEFERRASLQHALVREVLARYEDVLLGLSTIFTLRGHQGALHVASTPGEGSGFQLLLPPVAAGAYAAGGYGKIIAARPAETAAPSRHPGQALIIEDEDPVRMMTGEMLKTFGLQPQGAADGVTGLALFKQDPEAIAVVMLDLLMPGMSGEQVLKQLRVLKPDVRVLLMSGFNEGDVLGRLASPDGRLGFVAKPYTRAMLESGLRKLLES